MAKRRRPRKAVKVMIKRVPLVPGLLLVLSYVSLWVGRVLPLLDALLLLGMLTIVVEVILRWLGGRRV